jgi:hypothetical protein
LGEFFGKMLDPISELSVISEEDLFSEIFNEVKKNNTLRKGDIKELRRIFEQEEWQKNVGDDLGKFLLKSVIIILKSFAHLI